MVSARPSRPMVIAAVLAALSAPAFGQFDPRRVFIENQAVADRFPDPEIDYQSPAFKPGKTDFTSHAEMMDHLFDVASIGSPMRIVEIGRSQEDREIPLVVFAKEPDATPASDRPVVLFIGQQHGDEPAGGEAALLLADMLARGGFVAATAAVDVLVLPRANPDGAEAFRRTTSGGIDVNRDHTLLRTPEGRTLAEVFRRYRPHVVVDMHEFTVAGRWIPKLGGIQRVDAMLQYATTPNLPARLTEAQHDLFLIPVRQALNSAGITHDWYHTTDGANPRSPVSMGGITADTGRNVAGLRHAVSMLVETRGVGIGRQEFKRRVHTHLVAAGAILNAAAANAGGLLELRRALDSEVAARQPGSDQVVLAEQSAQRRILTLIDPDTGLDRPVEVAWRSSLTIEPLLSRPKPAAYALAPFDTAAAVTLAGLGVRVERLTAPARLPGERYRALETTAAPKTDVRGDDTGAGSIVTGRYQVEPGSLDLPEGSFIVPTDQPLANLLTALLEPESATGFVANRVSPIPIDKVLTISRLASREGLVTAPMAE